MLDQPHYPGLNGNQANCPIYNPDTAGLGAYIRWSVIRRNSMSGISLAQQQEKRCASVTNSNENSTDLLSEHNVIDCPEGGTIVNANNPHKWPNISCLHCVTRP